MRTSAAWKDHVLRLSGALVSRRQLLQAEETALQESHTNCNGSHAARTAGMCCPAPPRCAPCETPYALLHDALDHDCCSAAATAAPHSYPPPAHKLCVKCCWSHGAHPTTRTCWRAALCFNFLCYSVAHIF